MNNALLPNPREFKLPFSWPSIPASRGQTLQQIFQACGAAPLIEMINWKKIEPLYPDAKRAIGEFLRLPEVEPAGREAVKGMRETKSARPKQRYGPTNSEREKQANFGW